MVKVFITGGRSGIGYEVGKFLAKRGHLVYLGCKTVSEVFSLREKIKYDQVNVIPIKFDIRSNDIFMLKALQLDCLFCHAGVGVAGDIVNLDEKSFRDVYEVNVFSNIRMIKLMIKIWKSEKKRGKIFVTSSMLNLFPVPSFGIYASSKSSLSMLVKCLIKEEKSIRFCLVEPGSYHTGFNQAMVDNKEWYQKMGKKDYTKSFFQRKFFSIIESDNIPGIARKIGLEVEKKNPKKILRVPFLQGLALKFYFLFFS